MKHRLTPFALLPLLCNLPAHAQKETLQVDPAKSNLQFTLQASLHAVHGTFHINGGAVTFDETKTMSGSIDCRREKRKQRRSLTR